MNCPLIQNKENKHLAVKCQVQNFTIFCHAGYGPTFGGGHDICIHSLSNANNNSYSNFGHSYKHAEYVEGTNEAKSLLVGSYNFQIVEIEVYTKK